MRTTSAVVEYDLSGQPRMTSVVVDNDLGCQLRTTSVVANYDHGGELYASVGLVQACPNHLLIENVLLMLITTCTILNHACSDQGGYVRSNTKDSGSKERRDHWQEVHRQRVRLIQQQESDDCHSQSLGLVKLSSVMQLNYYEAPLQ